MNPWWVVALAGVMYGCAAFLAVQLSATLCREIEPFDDGPAPAKPPAAALIAGACVVGIAAAVRGADLPALAILCVLTVSLAASWYSDVKCGIVPDYFTLVPLALVLVVSAFERNAVPAISAAIVFVPFAIAAFISKGRGMGWGDVKLVALGAAVLGLQTSILAFSAACLIAVVIAAVRRRRTQPIAFAPYLAGSIAFVIVFPVVPQ